MLSCPIQVYLVVGGSTGGVVSTDTTEVFTGGRWRSVGVIPVAVKGLAGVTIENTVFMTGLYDTSNADVLQISNTIIHTCFRRA